MPRLIKVTGASMEPVLHAGDYIVTIKPRSIRAGLIYVMEHERKGRIIKRVRGIDGTVAAFASDNPDGISGDISTDKITARAWLAVTPKGIKRL